ncbi:MAG TPA: NAD(P)H-binding protein [Gemmatimonadaceae bacterium]|nr:NAD(P)H-binding protein [Gemmatimonadaceae bacterium]
MPVLVVGGTRGTGLLAVRLLEGRGVAVRVLARNPIAVAARTRRDMDIVRGDVTEPDTLVPAVRGASAVIYTAGTRSGHLAGEERIRSTDFEGVVHTLAAACESGSVRRLIYMTSIGGVVPSLPATLLNVLKGNVLTWRRRAEAAIRASGLDYTIVRAGFLSNARGGRRAIQVSQGDLPLALRYRIARADVAEVFVEALHHEHASRATFEAVWGKGPRVVTIGATLSRLRPDAAG